MKNIHQIFASIIAIVFITITSITSSLAQPTNDECFEKLKDIQRKSTVSEKENRNNEAESLRGSYLAVLEQKQLFEGECASYPRAFLYLGSADVMMTDFGRKCLAIGAGATCGVSSDTSNLNNSQSRITNDSPPPKKLTGAEQKRQNQQQKIEDKMSQSQQLAESTQAKADAARQGKRKTHDSAAVASQCIKVNRTGTYGSLDNVCNFKINYVECHYQPNDDYLVCEKQRFGAGAIGPNKKELSLVKNVEAVYWFACKEPAWPLDREFIDNAQGRGISARCAIPGTSN